MVAYAVEQCVANLGSGLLFAGWIAAGIMRFGIAVDLRDRMVTADLPLAVTIDQERAPRRQRLNLPVPGKRLRNMAEQVEADLPCRIQLTQDSAARDQGPNLRSKTECPAVVGVVERFDAIG